MYDLERVTLDSTYIVRDRSTSDGSQTKYNINNKWYKIDKNGGEAESEVLASILLECSNLTNDQFVHYDKLLINDNVGCVSDDFRSDVNNEEFITLYRLYKNTHGNDLASITSKMDYDDAIMFVINFVKKTIHLDISSYLANVFYLDEIILNTDRHFNNYGIIMIEDDYKPAPIFDNGKSLLTGQYIKESSIEDAIKKTYSKSFSPSFSLNSNFLREYRTIKIDKNMALARIGSHPDSIQKQVLMHQINRLL